LTRHLPRRGHEQVNLDEAWANRMPAKSKEPLIDMERSYTKASVSALPTLIGRLKFQETRPVHLGKRFESLLGQKINGPLNTAQPSIRSESHHFIFSMPV
jgi:hypothetical protein